MRLELDNVSKSYGDVKAVDGVTLSVGEGEIVALVGPSGCGKTSTMKMIAGLESISRGEIRFGERRVNELSPRERDIAMCFEDYALYPRMDVEENVSFPLRVKGWSRAALRERVDTILTALDLARVRKKAVDELSGGEQQRVSIARALVREPAVLLLDEPLSHLDVELRGRLRGEIRRLQRESGVTTVLVTHDQAEAMAMAERIAVMNRGVVHQYGELTDIYQRPADVVVADFVGEPPMNMLPATLDRDLDRVATMDGAFSFPVRDVGAAGRGEGEVTLGVRPEDVFVSGASMDWPCTTARVRSVEWLGEYQVVMLDRWGEDELWLTALDRPDRNVGQGMELEVSIDPGRVLLFDPRTGVRIGR